MESLKKAYEIAMGSVVVFVDSMFFAGMLVAVLIDIAYQLLCWAAWILSI